MLLGESGPTMVMGEARADRSYLQTCPPQSLATEDQRVSIRLIRFTLNKPKITGNDSAAAWVVIHRVGTSFIDWKLFKIKRTDTF